MNSRKNIINIIKMFLKFSGRTKQILKTGIDLFYRNQLYNLNKFDKIPMPRFIGVKLTNKCDLRCKMCMQWGKKGSHYNYSKEEKNMEIKWDNLKKILITQEKTKPTVILWGGEPLLYSKFADLLYLLDELKYPFDICTNGINLDKYIDTFKKIKNNFGILVSLDGVEKINDSIRGRGSFKKIINGIHTVIDINNSRKNSEKILLGIEVTIVKENIEHLYNFCEYLNNMDLSWIIFNMQWILNKETGMLYEDYLLREWFNNKKNNDKPKNWSWTNYLDHINKDKIIILKNELTKIQKNTWKIPVIFQPPITPDNIEDYYYQIDKPTANRRHCRVHWSKIEIYPDGSIFACKQFPDVKLGNIYSDNLEEIWNGDAFINFRKLIKKSILPICAKCPMLYTYGK